MTTKLTLRLNEAVINKAKKTASKKGVSLSRMVEDYFKAVGETRKRRRCGNRRSCMKFPAFSRARKMLNSCARVIGNI